jgi:hypothetical protein
MPVDWSQTSSKRLEGFRAWGSAGVAVLRRGEHGGPEGLRKGCEEFGELNEGREERRQLKERESGDKKQNEHVVVVWVCAVVGESG